MNFQSPPMAHHEQKGLLSTAAIAEEVFLKSLNTSYIGRMSGQKQLFHRLQKEHHEFEPITPIKQKRIDFSRFRGEIKQEIRESLVSEEDLKFMYIRSFAKGEEEMLGEPTCGTVCHSSQDKNRCKLEMINESTLEVYTSGDGTFNALFASINFDTVSARIQFEEIPANRQLAIVVGKYRLLLEHDKRQVVEYWNQQLEKMYKQSKGREIPLTRVPQIEDFYKERFETEDFFTKNCETGDVLLFQDDHFFAKAQRFFTRSNFDHVGMVVKDANYGLLIFQSNSGSGVCLTPWRYVIRYGWYKSIPKISWRRLKVNRDKAFNDTVEKFILQNLQKNYHISLAKITAHQSVIRPIRPVEGPKNTKDLEDQSGFFCSELVATLYKELGLLTRDRQSQNYQPACKFYPKDFSERGERKLDRGELSPQYTIYFDKALLKLTYRGLIHDD